MRPGGEDVQEWFSAAELAVAALPGLPSTKRGITSRVHAEGWAERTCPVRGRLARPRKGRGGGLEFHVSLLPEAARVRLTAGQAAQPERPDRETAWSRWDSLPEGYKATAQARLEVIREIETLQRGGLGRAAAVEMVVRHRMREATAAGTEPPFKSCSTVYVWLNMVAGVDDADRAAYLAPAWAGRSRTSDCASDAWETYKGLYLTQSKAPHAACYRRLERVAADNGWTIPSPKTLQRRMDAEVPPPIQTLLRYGEAALSHAFPHLTRDRSSIRPMQYLNLDGHTWDVMVKWPNGTISRPQALVVQDIKSGKVLAIRHDLTLNHHLVRLALGDTFRDHGLCEGVFMDNGRENAAQAISGGQARNRWGRTPEEEPAGLLKTLGIKAIAVTPYWGQAKPIERAFRNFAHDIAKGPEFVGAYVGHNTVSKPENYGSRAVPFAEFEAIVRREIEFYNAQPGRRGAGMNGRSFDQAFAAGLEGQPVRRLTAQQLRMCLLASKPVSMDPQSGAVAVEGHRYWSPSLGDLVRQKVIVRFDPERMELAASVYSLDGRFLAEAPRVAAGSFDRASDGREQRAALRDFKRGVKLQAQATRRLDAPDVAARLQGAPPPDPIITDPTVIAVEFNAPRNPEQLGRTAGATKDHLTNWERGVDAALAGRR